MAAFVAAIAALAGPSRSQASFTIHIDDGTNNFNVIASGNTYSNNNIVVGGFNIQISASSNSPGSIVDSQVSNTALAITAANGAIAATTLTISVTVDGFTNAASGTAALLNTRGSASKLAGTATGFTTLNLAHVTGSDVNLPNGGGFDQTNTGVLTPSDPYSLGNTMVLSLGAYSGPKDATLANVTIDSTLMGQGNFRLVPAPAGLILAVTAVPFLGLLRRRLRRAETVVAA